MMNRFFSIFVFVLSLCGCGAGWGQGDELPLPQERFPGAPVVPPPVRALEAVEMPDLPIRVMPVPSRTATVSTAVPSSTSSSGQFIVYGPDLRVRSGIAGKCEDISVELGRLLRTPDPWVRTVVVQIKALTANDPPDLGITTQVSALTHGGFHLQTNVPERSGLRPADFRRELIRLLLTERVLRSHKRLPDERQSNLVPAWVHTGVIKALDYRLRGRPSAEFAAIFKSGKIFGIEEILDAEGTGLDGLSRTIYETSCCALMMAVMDQPDGPLRFSRYLAALAQEEKPQRELLKQWFPALAESDTSLNKWWSLQLALLAAPSMSETLDPSQTAELLDRALTFLVPAIPDRKLPEARKVMSLASQRPAPLKVPEGSVKESEKLLSEVTSVSLGGAAVKKVGTSKPAKPPTKSVSSRPKELPEAPVVVEESSEEEKAKRGFLRNFLPFGKGGTEKEDKPAKEEEGKMEAKTNKDDKVSKDEVEAAEDREKELKRAQEMEAKENAAEEKVAREKAEKEKEAREKSEKEKARKEAAEVKKAAEAKPEASKMEVPAEKAAESSENEGRGRSLNPLKWFRGDKGSKEDVKEPKNKEASVRLFDPAALSFLGSGSVEATRALVVRHAGQGRFVQAPVETTAGLEGGVAGSPFPVEDFAIVMGHPEKQKLLSQMRLALQDVAVRGNALFRDIANDYISVINELSVGKTKGIDEKLKALRKKAVETYVQACAVQDHLDWYEATQSTRYSGLFEDFLTLPERVREELPPRKDPISKYLDEVEALLNR